MYVQTEERHFCCWNEHEISELRRTSVYLRKFPDRPSRWDYHLRKSSFLKSVFGLVSQSIECFSPLVMRPPLPLETQRQIVHSAMSCTMFGTTYTGSTSIELGPERWRTIWHEPKWDHQPNLLSYPHESIYHGSVQWAECGASLHFRVGTMVSAGYLQAAGAMQQYSRKQQVLLDLHRSPHHSGRCQVGLVREVLPNHVWINCSGLAMARRAKLQAPSCARPSAMAV